MMPPSGLRVPDLPHVPAGPCAARHPALFGADVIKIERPPARDCMGGMAMLPERGGLTAAFHGVNAGKRSLAPARGAPKLGADGTDALHEAGFTGAGIAAPA